MKKTKHFCIRWFTLAAALMLLLSSCGGGGYSSAEKENSSYAAEDYVAETEAAAEEPLADGEAVGTADYNSFEAPEMSDEAAAKSAAGDDDTSDSAAKTKAEEKLVYTCSMTMQTLTYKETVANIRAKIKEAGGIIESEEENNSDTYWYETGSRRSSGKMRLYLTVRIPTPKYESFLASLEGEGNIMNKSSSVENISRQYRDTQAIIRNLETQEERLQQMMDRAETIEEMIQVESRLTEVQTQLDQHRTRLASYDTDVALSTVNLTVEEVARYSDDPPKTDTFADRLQEAIAGSISNFLTLCEKLLFAAIYLLPVMLLVLVIFLIVWGIHRAYRKKHPKKPKAPKPPRMPKGKKGPVPQGQNPQGPQGVISQGPQSPMPQGSQGPQWSQGTVPQDAQTQKLNRGDERN